MVEGKLQIEGEVIHVVVNKCYNLNSLLKGLTETKNIPIVSMSRSDETSAPVSGTREVFDKGRNFK
jgi:error-prone DNA polymerase